MDIQHHIDDVQLNTFTITFDDGEQYVAFESDYDYRAIESLRSQLQQSEARVKELEATIRLYRNAPSLAEKLDEAIATHVENDDE